MNFEHQLLFFFSALGAFNGLLLSIYFAYSTKHKRFSNYFLSLLLLVLSIRIIKSVFFYFSPHLSVIFIQIGLSACALIGPYLYLYISSLIAENQKKINKWVIHIIPVLLVVIVLGIIYPYWTFKVLWSRYIVNIIYFQWFIYIILTSVKLKGIFKKLFSKKDKLNDIGIWQLSIFTGTTVIWLAYSTVSYTSYIVGALSFSFVLYLLVLLWIFKRNKNTLFFEEKIKYENKKITPENAKSILADLSIINDKMLYKNPNLKLSDLAKQINILPHELSQFLNDNLGKSFSFYINEYRIEEAKQLLISNDNYSIEAIGYECGFNSKSTFFTTFKKVTGTTPAIYKSSKT